MNIEMQIRRDDDADVRSMHERLATNLFMIKKKKKTEKEKLIIRLRSKKKEN